MRKLCFVLAVLAALMFVVSCSEPSGGGYGDGSVNPTPNPNPDPISTEIEKVLVSAGSFVTEGSYYSDYTNGVKVEITEGFYISKYPITQAQYRAVMGNNPSWFIGDNRPVDNVSWYDANEFCEKVGGFLPTEAQWEYATRGGNKSQGYTYSGSDNIDDVGWYWDNNSDYGTKPVGQKQPNELGIYDMTGNVWEWTADWYTGSYPGSTTNPTGPSSGSDRVLRGGSWGTGAEICRVVFRKDYCPECADYYVGFRVAFPRNSIVGETVGGGDEN